METCEYALQKGLALIVSDHLLTDCSCQGGVFGEKWELWVEWFEQHKLSWLTWNISGKNESCSLLMPGADPRGHWSDADLSEAGRLVRHRIKTLNHLRVLGDQSKITPNSSDPHLDICCGAAIESA
jgi:endoglucanase